MFESREVSHGGPSEFSSEECLTQIRYYFVIYDLEYESWLEVVISPGKRGRRVGLSGEESLKKAVLRFGGFCVVFGLQYESWQQVPIPRGKHLGSLDQGDFLQGDRDCHSDCIQFSI
ncbi:hypothetical protein SLA2020_228870 [Shorea laevis]